MDDADEGASVGWRGVEDAETDGIGDVMLGKLEGGEDHGQGGRRTDMSRRVVVGFTEDREGVGRHTRR